MEHNKLLFNKVINDLAKDDTKSFHSLIELSTTQWKRYGDNCICVTGIKEQNLTKPNTLMKYSTVKFGEKLHLQKHIYRSKGKTIHCKRLLLKNIRGGFCMIVGEKTELMLHNPNLMIADGSGSEKECDSDRQYKGSGYVMMFLGRLQRQTDISKYLWGKEKTGVVRYCKSNIIKGNSSHHGSSGNYFSFGNRANYGLLNRSSVTQYVPKKYRSNKASKASQLDAEFMEKIVGRELELGILYLSTIIPNLKLYIAPVLSVANQIQNDIGSCNIKELECSSSGLWNCSLCISCQTEELHTENDFTYTVINTPAQVKNGLEVNFLFQLQDKLTVGIELIPGFSFLFSGKYLTHRQSVNDKTVNDGEFINIASYGNHRLYNHIKSTVKRTCVLK